jgi:transposase InsO family protein
MGRKILTGDYPPENQPQEAKVTRIIPVGYIDIDLSLPAQRVIRGLNRIIEWRGKPGAIRLDNGPEYISEKLREWAENRNIIL